MPPPTVRSFLGYLWTHPSNRGRQFQALGDALRWQLHKRLRGGPLVMAVRGGFKIKLDPAMISGARVVYYNGRPEYHEMGFVEHYLQPGDAFLDIGANIGIFTLLGATRVGPGGHVDALECMPRAVQWLEENVALNSFQDRVTIHTFAASDRDGTLQFWADRDGTNHILAEGELGTNILEVPTRRLDDALTGHHWAMAKMDIEGAEPLALAGATQMLAEANPPVWLLELNGSLHRYGWTESGLAEWLAEQGYDLAIYDADTRQLSYPDRPWEQGQANVLAIARSQRAQVEARLATSRA